SSLLTFLEARHNQLRRALKSATLSAACALATGMQEPTEIFRKSGRTPQSTAQWPILQRPVRTGSISRTARKELPSKAGAIRLQLPCGGECPPQFQRLQ